MDTNSPNSNPRSKQKLEPELARYQRVLDAYHAHPGDAPEPSGALDRLILSRAESALAPSKATAPSMPKRRWPMAIAASVATIGFAAILARHSLREPAPNYEIAPAMQQSKAVAPAETSAARRDDAGSSGAGPAGASTPAADVAVAAESAKRESASNAMPGTQAPMAPPPPAEPIGKLATATETAEVAADSDALQAAQAALDRGRQESDVVLTEQAPSASEAAEETSAVMAEPQLMEPPRAKRALAQTAPSEPAPVIAPAPAVAMPTPPSATAASPAAIEEKEDAGEGRVPDTSTGMATREAQAGLLRDEKADAAPDDEQARSAQGLTADPDAAFFMRLRALRAQGELQQARELLRKFHQDYPEKTIPEDLRDLLIK